MLDRAEVASGRTRLRSRITLGAAVQLAVRLSGLASGAVVASVLARSLGAVRFGEFSLLTGLAAIIANVADFGLSQVAVKRIASEPGRQRETIAGLVILKLAVGIAGTAAVLILPDWIGHPAPPGLATLLVGSTMLLAPLSAFQVVGQARLRLGAINALLVSQSVLWTAAVLVVSVVAPTVTAFALSFSGYSIVQAVFTVLVFRRGIPLAFKSGFSLARQLMVEAWPVGLTGLCVTAYYKLDGLLVYHYAGAASSGQYAAAYKFLDVLQVFPATIVAVLLPVVSRALDKDRRVRLIRFSLVATVAAAAPIAFGGIMCASELIRLVYGADFRGAVALLRVLLLAFPIISVGYIVSTVCISRGRTKQMATTAAVAALLNISVNVLLIPRLGAVVAAWTTVGTELLVTSSLTVVSLLQRDLRVPLAPWIKLLGASGAEVIALHVCRSSVFLLRVLAGGATYVVACIAFRVARAGEVFDMIGFGSLGNRVPRQYDHWTRVSRRLRLQPRGLPTWLSVLTVVFVPAAGLGAAITVEHLGSHAHQIPKLLGGALAAATLVATAVQPALGLVGYAALSPLDLPNTLFGVQVRTSDELLVGIAFMLVPRIIESVRALDRIGKVGIVCLVAGAWIAVPFSQSTGEAVWGAIRYTCFAVVVASGIAASIAEPRFRYRIIVALVGAGTMTAIFGVLQAHGHYSLVGAPYSAGLPNSLLGYYTDYAAYIGVTFSIAVVVYSRMSRRYSVHGLMLLVSMLIMGYAVIEAKSRGGLLVAGVGIVIGSLGAGRFARNALRLAVIGGFALLAFALAPAALKAPLIERLTNHSLTMYEDLQRRYVQGLGFHIMLSHPLGIGYGNFSHFEPIPVTSRGQVLFHDQETFFQVAMDVGWLGGFGAGLLGVCALVRAVARRYDTATVAGAAALAGLAAQGLNDYIIYDSSILALCGFAFVAALGGEALEAQLSVPRIVGLRSRLDVLSGGDPVPAVGTGVPLNAAVKAKRRRL